jgi:hypothetical protein
VASGPSAEERVQDSSPLPPSSPLVLRARLNDLVESQRLEICCPHRYRRKRLSQKVQLSFAHPANIEQAHFVLGATMKSTTEQLFG